MYSHPLPGMRVHVCLFMIRSESGAHWLALLAGSQYPPDPSVFVSQCWDCKRVPRHPGLDVSAEDLNSHPYAHPLSLLSYRMVFLNDKASPWQIWTPKPQKGALNIVQRWSRGGWARGKEASCPWVCHSHRDISNILKPSHSICTKRSHHQSWAIPFIVLCFYCEKLLPGKTWPNTFKSSNVSKN